MEKKQKACPSPENWFMTLAGGVQCWIDRPGLTHRFINRQTVRILMADGYAQESEWLRRHLTAFNRGAVWADADWKNVHHYFNPATKRGLWRFHSAVEDFAAYFGRALKMEENGDSQQAAFYLGASAHLLQDLCVPHHARSKLLDGHKEFEAWAACHRNEFKVSVGGLYYNGCDYVDWLYGNAEQAADLYDCVAGEAQGADYLQAAKILLPSAQRSTAGLLERFLQFSSQRTIKWGRFTGKVSIAG